MGSSWTWPFNSKSYVSASNGGQTGGGTCAQHSPGGGALISNRGSVPRIRTGRYGGTLDDIGIVVAGKREGNNTLDKEAGRGQHSEDAELHFHSHSASYALSFERRGGKEEGRRERLSLS